MSFLGRYSVPLMYIHAFREQLVEYLRFYKVDADVGNCEDVLRHKKYILEPEWFRIAGIPLVRLVQKPGEYVVTFPKGYHFGVNLGINFNEAVNVATPESWIDWGKFATVCTCELVCFLFFLFVFHEGYCNPSMYKSYNCLQLVIVTVPFKEHVTSYYL